MTLAAVPQAVERLLLTLWVGGLWTTGWVLAPVLFRGFDRALAGEVAGRLFSAVSLLGIVCAVLLLGLALWQRRAGVWRDWRAAVVLLMLGITLIGEFGIAARMRELKEVAQFQPPGAAAWVEFGRLHGVASALYLLNSALGLWLVLRGTRLVQVGK